MFEDYEKLYKRYNTKEGDGSGGKDFRDDLLIAKVNGNDH